MLALADVTETGLPAAAVMATTRATLRGAAHRMLPPREALEYSNGLLCPELDAEGRVSCVYGILDPTSGRLQLANAGFNAPVLSHNGDGRRAAIAGDAVGRQPRGRVTSRMRCASIPASSFCFTAMDWSTPATRAAETFGAARLASILAGQADGAEAFVEILLAEVNDFTGRTAAQDSDVTLIVVERMAANPSGVRSG